MSGPRFSIIPAGAIFDRSLEPRDLHVLNLLGCHTDKAGWCRRSQVRMAAELDCSRSSVQRSLDRLCEAGWVQKKRAPWSNQEGQPSNSYMYRVVLDRDDDAASDVLGETETGESYASNASQSDPPQDEDCPPVGTPPAEGHPGAQPYVGTGAQPYVGTKNVPLERPLIERERDARARDRNARFLIDFEKRWPTAAADDRQRTAYAAESLSEDEQAAALAGMGPFLDNLKRLHRRNVPAGWRYLEEKRWTLLEQPKTPTGSTSYPRDSIEAKAIAMMHEIAGCGEGFRKIYRQPDGSITYRKPMTPQLVALAQAPPREEWQALDRRGAGAWEGLLRDAVSLSVRKRISEGELAPWPFPPSVTGKIYATGPPSTLMSEDDLADFK